MHQPDYRNSDGEFMLPWVYLHALKDYIDMPLAIMANTGMKANINITPVLIDQWQDYNYRIKKSLAEKNIDEAVHILPDIFLKPLLLKSFDGKNGVNETMKLWMLDHYRWANYEQMVSRYDEYKILYDLASSDDNSHYLNDAFYFDLCVWFHLSWCGEYMKRYDPVINYFIRKGSGFTFDDRKLLLKRLSEWLEYGISLYGFPAVKGGEPPVAFPEYPVMFEKNRLKELNKKEKGKYEVTLSPHYHPIIPLLLNAHCGEISAQMNGIYCEPVNFEEYEDGIGSAKKHLDSLNEYYAFTKNKIKALWPSEGAVSAESLDLFSEYGIDICASGEELLSSSIGMDAHRPVFSQGKNIIPLYRVYKWKETGHKIIFRDSGLSDLIGFTYAKWRGDDAANNLIDKLHSIDDLDKDAIVSVILDGENPWEYYYENGFYFLNDLYSFAASSIKINPLLLSEIVEYYGGDKSIKLDYIMPGSWVNGNLMMWTGEEQKNKAWTLLNDAKIALYDSIKNGKIVEEDLKEALKNLMAAEGSDWFWWLGPDSTLFSQSSMEQIFRNFLKNIYLKAGKQAPEQLFESLSSTKHLIAERGGIMKRGREQ
jgi:alpha-amylase/alpha-mannosidase (GH57 family)